MLKVALAGIGVWSEQFSGWEQFCAFVRGDSIDVEPRLQPELIPARERRRAPTFVKMAVAVMDQACRMADVDRASVATVFASGMGDMQVTDYMCRTLATIPAAISPTKFHNSVHNASTGYWSIATGSHSPSSAISGYDRYGAM
jgi:3-oxoacyl-(acyl-carrier-protein) synthase